MVLTLGCVSVCVFLSPLSLRAGVGIFGLTGVDQLLCFMIVSSLSDFVRLFRKAVTKSVQSFLSQLAGELHPTSQFPANTARLYQLSEQKMGKLVPLFLPLVTAIGQMQLIRRQVANELNFSAKLDSKILSSALDTMNAALTSDVRAHYADPDNKPYPGNPTLPDIADYLETSGQRHSTLGSTRSTQASILPSFLSFSFFLADLFQPLISNLSMIVRVQDSLPEMPTISWDLTVR